MKATKAAAVAAPSAETSLDLGLLNEVVGFHVRRLQKKMTRNVAERILVTGVKPGAYTALALISANPGVSQTALAREMGFDKATIVALIDSLEAEGWASRERAAADRRRHSLALTRSGEAALKRLHLMVAEIEGPIRGELSVSDLTRLVVLLDRAYAALMAEQA